MRGNSACLYYAFFQKERDTEKYNRFPSSGFIKGDTNSLVDFLPRVVLTTKNIDALSNQIANRINGIADEINLTQHHIDEISEILNQYTSISVVKTSLVLWLNVFLTQQTIRKRNKKFVQPLPLIVADSGIPEYQVSSS
ncbi:MAG: hypothetical protein OXC92_06460 [Flavobacteriaceae bacterium]|nr:hypothetical protein [Flavobacteriaceae bacterium]